MKPDVENEGTSDNADKTMKVLGAMEFGSIATSFLSFHHVSRPLADNIGPTEVIIKISYSDLNPVDHHKLKGNKPSGTSVPHPPLVVGFGGSGIVVSINESLAEEKTKDLLGKRVAFLGNPSKPGSYAEYIVCDHRAIAEIPDSVDFRMAATVPIAGCTALESMEKVELPIPSACASEGEGKRLLVVGGAGGVGSWITQLARACFPKIEIICTASSQASSKWCKKMGADKIIGHDEIISLGGGPKGSVDSIICLAEPSADLFNSLSEVLRPYGKICLVVAGAGIKSLDLGFVFFKCGTVATETVFSSVRDGYRLDQSKEMGTIMDLMKVGKVQCPLNEDVCGAVSDSWKEAMKEGGAIDIMGSGHNRGKLVMKID